MKFFRFIIALSVVVSMESFSMSKPVADAGALQVSASSASCTTDGSAIYDLLKLGEKGLSFEAFDLALHGMKRLQEKGLLKKTNIITVADLSQSSCRKRLYVIDLENQKVLFQTYVAHGKNSGEEYARSFSNQPHSNKSSIGFYVTLDTYDGDHGLALRLEGEEPGVNDKAFDRGIVMHAADYANENFIQQTGRLGRSEGCPAVPPRQCATIINAVKNGSCLFIYYPDSHYLHHSNLLVP